ncbi:chromosome segregation protein SMC [Hydrogenobacter hydrogenophilus]|uniref:Chromosome partition protein Smc n=1 Tax=Hydrogenobacter hydrogenophilus TaxID=35835 RepID=A0A285NY72_9AQUI|nr:chromosome segregation protein SMC [Hydrogenobacter hydrogenophilus]SNZ14158.1 condensin subunit Smc [Hydrogenobacter hydrogenophilus]
MTAWIEKLVVEGFKSYGKGRVEIPLGPGFIGIVGPNGAGKSNIGDAISFALGLATAKTLRAKNLSYLIYSKDGEASQYAYVEVHFKNEGAFPIEEDKLVISRKVDKEGRSVFRINGTVVRERDLRDFLARAGLYENAYNIVLQGDVVRFVKMTPVERRKLIEEVAGIGEYEEKKQKALTELGEVELKLRELRLLIDEMEVQMERLSQEVEKLRRYRELESQLRELQIRQLMKDAKSISQNMNNLEKAIEEKKREISEIRKDISKLESEHTQKEEELREINAQLFPFRERLGRLSSDIDHTDKRIQELENKRNQMEEDQLKAKERIKNLSANLEKLLEEEAQLKDLVSQKEKEVIRKEEEVSLLYQMLKSKEEGLKVSIQEVHATEEKINAVRKEMDQKKEHLSRIELKLRELDIKSQKVQEDMQKLKEEEQKLKSQMGENALKMENYKKMQVEEEHSVKKKKQELERLEEKLRALRYKREEVIKEKAGISAKLASLHADTLPFEGIRGVYGRVYELIKVKNPEYIKAVESAGAGRLSYVVVEDEDVAKECIQRLKETKRGRLNFIPLNRIKPTPLPPYPRRKGYIDFVVNLVEYDSKFERAIKFVFGDTLLVEDFQSAKDLGIGNYRMVTLEGEVFEKSGVISGGHTESRGDLGREFYTEQLERLSKAEKDLKEEEEQTESTIKTLRDELIQKEGVLRILERRIKDIEESDKMGFERLKEIEEKLRKAEEYISRLAEEKENLLKEKNTIMQELSYLEEKLNNLIIKRQSILEHYKESGIESLRENYEKSRKALDHLKEATFSLSMKLKELQSDIQNLRAEINRNMAFLESSERTKQEIEDQIEKLKEERRKLEEGIKELERTAYELYSKKDQLEEVCTDLQAKIGRLRLQEEAKREELTRLETEYAKIEEKHQEINLRFRELGYEGPIEEVKEGYSKLKEAIDTVRKELSSLGTVNFKAEDDYREYEERHRDYTDRYKKLSEEKRAIKEMIEEIETKKLNAFNTAFESINEGLKRVFAELSPGGKAYMQIENPQDPFSGGINLVVKPKGKEVQYIDAISGGEKTLVALALIFSIQDYKPSPFYYFDEVDAHLDEANARRIGELIRKRSQKAQFIVVTLREILASYADRLIGVSSRGGVSRVFPVKNFLVEVAND